MAKTTDGAHREDTEDRAQGRHQLFRGFRGDLQCSMAESHPVCHRSLWSLKVNSPGRKQWDKSWQMPAVFLHCLLVACSEEVLSFHHVGGSRGQPTHPAHQNSPRALTKTSENGRRRIKILFSSVFPTPSANSRGNRRKKGVYRQNKNGRGSGRIA